MRWFSKAKGAPLIYPVASLPVWAQAVSRCLPMTYIFEGVRQVLQTGQFSMASFLTSVALNVCFLIVAILLFKYSFRCSRIKGLARLE